MADPYSRPEAMNTTTSHPKLKLSLSLSRSLFVAGTHPVSGTLSMQAHIDRGLGLGAIYVEIIGSERLSSRDHSAVMEFLNGRKSFQGGKLPPSNSVYEIPLPMKNEQMGERIPEGYWQAKKGSSEFPFKLSLPSTCPSSISFGGGLARVKYELKASVEVFWKGERSLLIIKDDVDVVESFVDPEGKQLGECVAVGEQGKLWCKGNVVGGGVVVAGESACVELMVRNHSNKKV
jgi:hypothetical protein